MLSNASILLIDDEEDIRFSLRGIFEDEGSRVTEARNGLDGLSLIQDQDFDLIFLDIWMPGMDGMSVLKTLRDQGDDTPVIMISGHGNIENAVTALKSGAFDFIEKPLSLDNILVTAEKALELSFLKRENKELRSRIKSEFHPGITGKSPSTIYLKELIDQVAPTDAWVLITGENGTGKEVAARAVHVASKRADREMICVNCAAIPEELIESELFGHEKGAFTGADKAKKGKFELADQSTLFLDEIADMSLKTQAKILRILQEQKFERVGGTKTFTVDVRVIAATNKDLNQEMIQGRFRQDLFYRLNVFPLTIPPLRERVEDIPELITFFTKRLTYELNQPPISFDQTAMEVLAGYSWPGNIRELKNFVERLYILYPGKVVTAAMLPPEYKVVQVRQDNHQALIDDIADFKEARSRFEEIFLRAHLERVGGNISRLAESIGLERTYLYRKLKAYNINGDERKQRSPYT
ncbi:MAG: sigma-54 dependent transcriptional regulator [Desulfomicrobium sp.]|nr:sigma-54 dependent transcriptional regulator [Desulfomicrobium sp.]